MTNGREGLFVEVTDEGVSRDVLTRRSSGVFQRENLRISRDLASRISAGEVNLFRGGRSRVSGRTIQAETIQDTADRPPPPSRQVPRTERLRQAVNRQVERQIASEERLLRTRETVRGFIESPLPTPRTRTGRRVRGAVTGFISDVAISPFAVGEGIGQAVEKLELADRARGNQGIFGGGSLIQPRSPSLVSQESRRAAVETGQIFNPTTSIGRSTLGFAAASALLGTGARPVRRVTDVRVTIPEAPLITGRVTTGTRPSTRPRRVQSEFDVPTLEVFDPSQRFFFRGERRGGRDLFFGRRGQASLDQILAPPRLRQTPETRVSRRVGRVSEPTVELRLGLEAQRPFPAGVLSRGISSGATISRSDIRSAVIPSQEVVQIPESVVSPAVRGRQAPVSLTGVFSSTAQAVESFSIPEQRPRVRGRRSSRRRRRQFDFDLDFLSGSGVISGLSRNIGLTRFVPSLTASVFNIRGPRTRSLEVAGLDIRPIQI